LQSSEGFSAIRPHHSAQDGQKTVKRVPAPAFLDDFAPPPLMDEPQYFGYESQSGTQKGNLPLNEDFDDERN